MTPDISEASRFLGLLDPSAKPFTFQTFDDSEEKRSDVVRVLHGTLAQRFNTLAELNAKGAGVFVTINETDFKRRTAENIVRVRAIFEDHDSADAVQRAEADACQLDPHIVVESSPGKRHVYRLVTDVPLERFKPWQEHMIALMGSDPKPKDLPRVMRLPGFYHCKADHPHEAKPFMTRILTASDHPPYCEDELALIFGDPSTADEPMPDQVSDRPALSSDGVIPKGGRDSTLFSLAGTMRRAGMSREAIEAALLAENLRCDPKLPDATVKDMAKRISTRYEGGSLPGASRDAGGYAPFPFVPCSDLLAGPKAARWLVRNWIEAGSLNQLFGESGAGKSFVALDWCLSIATGQAWNGCTVQKGAVFYITSQARARPGWGGAWRHGRYTTALIWLTRPCLSRNMRQR